MEATCPRCDYFVSDCACRPVKVKSVRRYETDTGRKLIEVTFEDGATSNHRADRWEALREYFALKAGYPLKTGEVMGVPVYTNTLTGEKWHEWEVPAVGLKSGK